MSLRCKLVKRELWLKLNHRFPFLKDGLKDEAKQA